jgi:hypothetical protein
MFGCDPEIFSMYEQDNKVYAISPVTLEKEYNLRPLEDDFKHPIYYKNPRGKVIMDGAAFEINLFHPYPYASDMFDDVLQLWGEFDSYLNRKTGFKTIALPSINFDSDKYWTEEVDMDEKLLQGFIFGCDRSFNAKDNSHSETIDARHHNLRYGGGHIHFSDKTLTDNILQSVRVMDMLIGPYFMSKSHYKDEETQRSLIYGKPGSFRPQKYKDNSKGVEYRVCSNNWLNLKTKDFEFVEELVDKVKVILTDRNKLVEITLAYQDIADNAIQSADFSKCFSIWNEIMEV